MGLRLALIPPGGFTRVRAVSATDDGFRPPSVLAGSSLPAGGRAGLLHSSLPTVCDARKDRGSVVRARSNSGYYWQTQAEFYPTPPPLFFPPCQFRPGPIAPSSGGEASCNDVMQRGGGCCSGACCSLSFNRCNWH